MLQTLPSQKLHHLKLLVILVGMLMMAIPKQAFCQELDYGIHAKYIYYFTKYVDWPADRKTGPFIIGIIGNPDLFEQLTKVTESKKVRNQQIIVINLTAETDPSNCNILFIGRIQSKLIDNYLLRIGGRPVLIVGEKQGFAKKGADINFTIRDEMLRFEMNVGNCKSKGLKVAGELEKLSYRID
ncbi:MAG: YfiR family protein [Flavobacteriaceae bacterium]|nr:YfiR family protein [Flavobacteriaceae bacterium]